ncbi:MAG: hypothetical protein EXS32_14625 [Opitutus sp.]|nr:hypothetical protein [Opitutus sp.]
MIYLDTHVVVWLSAGEVARLGARARVAIETQELRVSPMVLLELQYLRSRGGPPRRARDEGRGNPGEFSQSGLVSATLAAKTKTPPGARRGRR